MSVKLIKTYFIAITSVITEQRKNKKLNQHIETKHNGVLYSCNKCNYKAVRKATLKTHVNSEHEGIS